MPGDAQVMTSSAIGWNPARKCTELFSATILRAARIDAEMREGLAMDRLLADARDQHLDAVLLQHRGLAHLRGLRAQHRRGALERAVAERHDRPGAGLRRLAGAGKSAADRRVEMRADAGRVRGRRQRRIMQDADDGALRALRQQFRDDAGGVRRRAGARIVLRVGEDHRLARARRNADRVRDRFGDRLHALRGELRLGGDHRIGEAVDRARRPSPGRRRSRTRRGRNPRCRRAESRA